MGFLDTFETRVRPAIERAFGVSVTLTQGASTTAAFTALRSDPTYELADGQGFMTKFQSRDWEFAVSDAAIVAVEFEPRRGDVIDVTENGVEKKFELVSMGDMPAAEHLAGGTRWRVHTKRVL